MGGIFDSKAFRFGRPPTAFTMGHFDREKVPDFAGIVHNKKTKGDLAAREAAKAGTVFSQASRYT